MSHRIAGISPSAHVEETRPSLLVRLRDPADQKAWRDFDRRYGELIVRYALARGLQLTDAEDVRQLVLINLSRSMPGFEYDATRGRFRDYLRIVARHAIARHQSRHAGREIALDHDVLEAMAGGDTAERDQAWERQWVRRHCLIAIGTLRREADRAHVDIFERLLAGDDVAAVAASRGLSEVAVRKIKQRIKVRLTGLIARQLREEDGDA